MKQPLLSLSNVSKTYHSRGASIYAVKGVSFDIYPGETLGLVGESGCGKSTVGKMIVRLFAPTSGAITFKGKPISECCQHQVQLIFQDPYASLNPRMTAGENIAEPLVIHSCSHIGKRVAELLDLVGLRPEHGDRFPHELSGGQRQRIGIARALALRPSLIVCDEPLAALDVSIQTQIVALLKSLQEQFGLTYLFISHDLAMVRAISTRIAVMYVGELVELAPARELYTSPLHPYTQGLIASVPLPDPTLEMKRKKVRMRGEVPGPFEQIQGCPFQGRCPRVHTPCYSEMPPLVEVSPGRFVACHAVT
jgi:oligopeptide/dipeptide ABC transporter ATP-binding protein